MARIFATLVPLPWLFFIAFISSLFIAHDNLAHFALISLLLSLFLVMALWHYTHTAMQLLRTRILLWLCLYWLWLVLELLLRPILSLSVYQFILLSSLPLVFFVMLLRVDWQQNWSKTFLILILVIILFNINFLVQFFLHSIAAPEFVSYKNVLNAILNLILWTVAARFLAVNRIGQWVCWGSMILLLSFSLALTTSAIMLLVTLVGYIVFNVCLWERVRANLLIGLSLLIFVGYGLGSSNSFGYHNPNSYWLVWQQTWEMIKIAPIFGHGLGTFAAMYPVFRLPPESGIGVFVHDDYLQLWDEIGIIGLLLWLAVLGSFGQLWRRFMRSDVTQKSDILLEVVGINCGLLTLILSSIFTFNFYISPILLLAAFLAARSVYLMSTTLKLSVVQIKISKYVRPFFSRLLLIFISLLCIVIAVAIMFNYCLTVRAEKYLQQNDPADTMYELVLAQTLWPLEQRSYEVFLQLDVQLLAEIPLTLPKWRTLIYQQGVEQFNDLHQVNPYNSLAFLYRGKLAEQNPGANDSINAAQAIYAYQYGLYLNDRAYAIRMAYANLLLREGKLEAASNVLLGGIALPYPRGSGVLQYYLLTRSVKEKLGDKLAVQTLDKLIAQNKKLFPTR